MRKRNALKHRLRQNHPAALMGKPNAKTPRMDGVIVRRALAREIGKEADPCDGALRLSPSSAVRSAGALAGDLRMPVQRIGCR